MIEISSSSPPQHVELHTLPPPVLEIEPALSVADTIGQDLPLSARQTALKWSLRGVISAAAFTVAIGVPAAEGAVSAIEHSPMDIQLADGLSFDLTVQPGSSTTVNALGAGGSFNLPAGHYQVPIIGNVGATVTPHPVQATAETMDVLTALITTPSSNEKNAGATSSGLAALQNSVEETATHHALEGALQSAGEAAAIELPLVGLMATLSRSKNRGRKQQAALDTLRDSRDSAAGDLPPQVESALAAVVEQSTPLTQKHSRLTKLAAAALAFAVAAVPAVAGTKLFAESKPAASAAADCGIPINPTLIAQLPAPAQHILRGATVCGSALQLGINTGLMQIIDMKNSTENYYQKTVVPNIQNAFTAWLANPNNKAYLDDPDYVRIAQKTDIHCSFPYSQWVAPAVMKGYQPDIVTNTGDTMVSTGTLPFEPACISIEADAIEAATQAQHKNVVEVAIEGNHDSAKTAQLQRDLTATGVDGKPYHPITVLDSHQMTATIDGIPFVGDMDPRASITGHPIADRNNLSVGLTPGEENQLVAKASSAVTKAACSMADKNAIKPILLTHERTESYPAMAAGCVSLAENGHYHQIYGPYAYTATNGNTSYEYTLGSSSGVDSADFTLYERNNRDATTAEFFVNKYTGQIAMSTLIVHHGGTVTLSDITPLTPATTSDAADVHTFMNTYLPSSNVADAAPATQTAAASTN